MSFIIAVYVNEGIVLASDRRTTYTNTVNTQDGRIIQRIGIHCTNSTDKTFLCPNKAGISTCGDASFLGKPITGFIKAMIREKITPETSVSDIPQIINDYFNSFESVPNTHFIVAGYVENGKKQYICKVNPFSKQVKTMDSDCQGATWDGETNTLTRLLQNVALKIADGNYNDLPYENVLWEYFTLQDAIDFAKYAVETTINTMRFKNVIETVGGKIDILVITPDKSFWLEKEKVS